MRILTLILSLVCVSALGKPEQLKPGELSEEQIKTTRLAAEKGDAEAQYKLGEHYYCKVQNASNSIYIDTKGNSTGCTT